MGLSDHITDIELATNAHDMRGPIARALETIAEELDAVTIDALPTEDSTNLVESNGVYQMWSDLVDSETFLLPTDQVLLGEKNITEPGSYDASDDGLDGYSHVEVNESAGQITANLQPKYIYTSGTYKAANDDCDGYSEVHAELDNSVLSSIVNRTISAIDPENNIDRIGPYAFYSCTQLQSAFFSACTSIEAHAFDGCTLLSTISASMCANISNYAFANCINLENAVFQNLDYIPEGAFLSCASLSICTTPSVLQERRVYFHHIESNAFANCYNFQGFGILASHMSAITNTLLSDVLGIAYMWITNHIGDYAFYNCSAMSGGVYIAPYDLFPLMPLDSYIDITIGKCAFENCINLDGIWINLISSADTLPGAQIDTLRIKNSAFRNCTNLSIFAIGDVFYESNSINKIIIESNAFENCNHIIPGNVHEINCWNALEIHHAAFRNMNCLPIPLHNVTYIGQYACQNLASPYGYNFSTGIWTADELRIVAPSESYAVIDNYAFENVAVKNAYFYSCYLRSMAFANCLSLSKINLYGTCNLDNFAFDGCLSLSTMEIRSSDVAISENTFANSYLDLYSTFSDINDKPYEPQILIRSTYFSIYINDSRWSKYVSYMKSSIY